MPVSPNTDLIGQVVDGRYKIRKLLGRGGMGVVYEAEAIRLGKRPCAIKVLLPEFTRNETVVARFEREAEVAARIKHPNVVEIFDTGQTASGLGYIAMELLVGETLDRTLKSAGPLPWPRVQKILVQVCRALAVAHNRGVIHRDIKPENIFRCNVEDDEDFVKVLDFGIAKLIDLDGDAETVRLTATNSVLGTYAYMSFEQICGEPIDHRVDIWAVGVLLYEMLTGRQPFRGTNQGQIWRAISTYDPEPMRDIVPSIPPDAEAVVQQALVKDRNHRFPTIEAFAQALTAVIADQAPFRPANRPTPSVAPAALVDVSAETDLGTDDLDQRSTQLVRPHGLTLLSPDALRPITSETTHSVVTPSTHPGRDQEPQPPRDAMQTAIIVPLVHESASVARVSSESWQPSTNRTRIVAFTSLVAVSAIGLVFYLFDATEPEPGQTARTEETPTVQPSASPPIVPKPDPPPIDPQPIAPPSVTAPAQPAVTPPASPIKPVEQSYSARVKEELRKARDRKDTKDCFVRFQVEGKLVVDIVVTAATGAMTVKYPEIKADTPLSHCLDKALGLKPFSKGKPNDKDIDLPGYVLNPHR